MSGPLLCFDTNAGAPGVLLRFFRYGERKPRARFAGENDPAALRKQGVGISKRPGPGHDLPKLVVYVKSPRLGQRDIQRPARQSPDLIPAGPAIGLDGGVGPLPPQRGRAAAESMHR